MIGNDWLVKYLSCPSSCNRLKTQNQRPGVRLNCMNFSMEPSQENLEAIFDMKYRVNGALSWGPAMRKRFNYFNPDDWYESLLNNLVTDKTRWLEVGCGRLFFPSNPILARVLSERCDTLVGLDPDPTLLENPYVHHKVHSSIQDYHSEDPFDLISLRMVAEHIAEPDLAVKTMAKLTHAGSYVVIYTIFKWSPVPVATYLTPFFIHHPIKKAFWGTESKDTFPVSYKMNTRSDLKHILEAHRFREVYFTYLDDCRTFAKFRFTLWTELVVRKLLNTVGLRYPEVCVLGVYERI